MAKPSRIVIPDEYVRTGRSIAFSSSANATISSKRCLMSARAEALDRAVQEDVLPAREVEVKARAELEERADAPFRANAPRRRLDDLGDDAEQRRLAGAVPADQPDGLAARYLGGDVPKRPHVGGLRLSALDEEILERARVACVHAKAASNAFDTDLTDLHAA